MQEKDGVVRGGEGERQRRASPKERVAGLELQSLREERGQTALDTDEDLLGLLSFGDMELVPGIRCTKLGNTVFPSTSSRAKTSGSRAFK